MKIEVNSPDQELSLEAGGAGFSRLSSSFARMNASMGFVSTWRLAVWGSRAASVSGKTTTPTQPYRRRYPRALLRRSTLEWKLALRPLRPDLPGGIFRSPSRATAR